MIEKDLKISNIKGLLIFLVVFGHLIELYKGNYYQIFVLIYAFHMPLFIFISGFLAKRATVSKIINFFILYIIFQSFFDWYLYFIGDYKTLQFHFGKPQFHLWYIVSMIFWYALAWGIHWLRPGKVGKTIIFLIVFALGFYSRWYTEPVVEFIKEIYPNFTSYTLSFQRTISFAPFFFAGFFISKNKLRMIYESIPESIAKGLLAVTAAAVILYIQYTPNLESLFRGSFGMERFLNEGESYYAKIMLHYLLSGWLCLLILTSVKGERSVLTKWGDHSITIFLFHPVFVFLLRRTEFMADWKADTQFIVYFGFAILISALLGSNVFSKISIFVTSPLTTLKKLTSVVIRKKKYSAD
ncbi:acyltransferase family protein [Bacillus haynesii]|uniref:Acyltransferase family protein n=2 Tax=Bacillus TaxID=1386 RepID=A0AA90J955_9BACI|nr:acyltransferase family protein [Bacillus haynesii]MCY7791262.1 acyltransferase family protein [Bacillus haynesii]MCY7849824.1 acyltransferase family protein [Bacillus haynesii]MCY7912231.1 acyltransferase family protein [Bacillus haynesii]MCY7924884.1 acyltransferase family protein [Bacillus haynesii]MCY8382010.1 acyltransferase family protein [Bacillus haynesii]